MNKNISLKLPKNICGTKYNTFWHCKLCWFREWQTYIFITWLNVSYIEIKNNIQTNNTYIWPKYLVKFRNRSQMPCSLLLFEFFFLQLLYVHTFFFNYTAKEKLLSPFFLNSVNCITVLLFKMFCCICAVLLVNVVQGILLIQICSVVVNNKYEIQYQKLQNI
jgi:hypothetical protein